MIECGTSGILHTRIAHIFRSDNYDIDQVIGVQNIRVQDPVELGRLAVCRLGAEFQKIAAGSAVVVGQRNFGYGHPHMQPMTALRQCGIIGIVADSFTPGFWLGAISAGFLLITCPGICDAVKPGDDIYIHWDTTTIYVDGSGEVRGFKPLSDFEKRLLKAGGIIELLENRSRTISDK